MEIEKLEGTAERLYQLVAPLVMKPSVLRQNNNYPFKTSARHLWFVATEEEEAVIGFVPVVLKERVALIDNYYAAGDELSILAPMLQEVVCYFKDKFKNKFKLQSVAHIRHLPVFEENGFVVIKKWKLYVKMEYLLR